MTGNVRFVYLAEPIDQAISTQWMTDQRTAAIAALNHAGIGVYRPASAFTVAGVPVGPEITRINTDALKHCSGVLAFLPAGVPTVGVPMEIEQAVSAGKPAAVVSSHEGWALYRSEPNLMTCEGWETAVHFLRQWEPFLSDDAPSQTALPFIKTTNEYDEFGPLGDKSPIELPRRGYADDAGLDLTTCLETTIEPGQRADIPTGVAAGFPPGVFGMIVGRSSALRRRGLQVTTAIIDPGFRGELYVEAFNPGTEPVTVKQGERLGQIILMQSMSRYIPVWVDELPPSHDGRGVAGFGSTGA